MLDTIFLIKRKEPMDTPKAPLYALLIIQTFLKPPDKALYNIEIFFLES